MNPLRRLGLVLRLSARGLARARGTSVLAITILALGLAAPTVFFSLLVGAIRPLPVPDGERVVRLDVSDPARAGASMDLHAWDVGTFRQVGALEAVGAFARSSTTLTDPETAAVRVSVAMLSPSVLPLLGVSPTLGRVPARDEIDDALMLAYDTWLEMYDGDVEALGRSITVEGRSRVVVGVMPAGFGFPFNEGAWIVEDFDARASDEGAAPLALQLVGRLADGATTESVTAEAEGVWRRGDPDRPVAKRGGVATVEPFTSGRGEGGEAAAFAGLVLVALCLLLIACANVANLLLVRATERVRTLGIQAALGAGRRQIGAQLMLESLLLALAGGAIGLLMAWSVVEAIERALSAEHFGYHWMRMAIDGRVVAFVTALVTGTALVSGAVPAVRAMSTDLRAVLRSAGAGGGRSSHWGRVFVTIQLSLSCAALVAAALTAGSLMVARGMSGDLPATEVLIAQLGTGEEASGDASELRSSLVDGLDAIPGVRNAAIGSGAPGVFETWASVELDGGPGRDAVESSGDGSNRTFWSGVTPAWFDLFDLHLRIGRRFDERDARGSGRVAVVNVSFAARFAPGTSVLGRAVRVGAHADSASWYTIVGVVSDARVGSGDRIRHDRVYLPFGQAAGPRAMALIRTDGADAGGLAPDLRRTLASVAPGVAVSDVRTLADAHAWLTRVPRAMGALALGGGLAGLFVAAVGLYALLAFRVRQRRHELGVRLALGADRRRLARETLGFAMSQLLPAVVIGLALAWLAGPLLRVIVLGLDPRSPVTLLGTGALFIAIGTLAVAAPTMRAARTDPAEALRAD